MSRTFKYTVREGDTVQDLSARFYGTQAEYPKIVNGNPKVATAELKLFPGQVLIIPAKQVLNQQRNEQDSGKDDVIINVDGVEYSDVWNFSLKRSIDKAADTFVFEIPFDPKDEKVKASFLPFQYKPIEIFIGGVLRLTGNIINVLPSIGTDKRILKISGYSTCGVMNDCMLPTSAYPPVFQTSTFFDICKTIASAFNIDVFDAVGDNTVFEEVDIKPTDKAYGFLSKLAKKIGVLLTSDVEGNLIIQKATNEKSEFTFEEGEPDIVGISANYKGQKGYTSVTGLLDINDALPVAGDDSVSIVDSLTTTLESILGKETPENIAEEKILQESAKTSTKFISGVPTPRPFVFEIDEINEGDILAATQAKMRRMWVEAVAYPVTLKGWRDPSGALWVDNKRLNVFYPSVMIYRTTEFLISAVNLQKQDDKKITQITLILPQSYNTEELENVPWLE